MEKYNLPGKDSWHNFDVVGEAYREAQVTAALGRRPRLDEEIEDVFEALLVPEPDNPHDANAVSVRVNGHVIGYLDREAAQVYRPIFHRIAASGMVATTTARIWAVVRESWEDEQRARFFSNVRIYLPEPHQILPLNNHSPANVAVLPWGGALQVTGEDSHFSHLFNYLPKNGEGLVILTMHRLIQSLKNGTEKHLVEVRLDGERVGQLTSATSNHYLPTVAHAADIGKELGIWAKIKGSGLAAELVVQGARATELNDEWLNTMPTFPPLKPEAAVYNVPPAFTGDLPTRRDHRATLPAPALRSAPTNSPSASPSVNITSKPLKGHVMVNEKDRRYSPLTHRLAGVAMIIIAVIVGAMLGAIPLIGPVLFIGFLALGIMGNIRSRKIAAVLEKERSIPELRL
ncbi:HIRAN domain-containing protein [Pseudarthrobacter sp. MDT3-26]|uniref:HIRAN domain-containing protein n=1 Tax=Pseudarthrobacter raffinosi TaxID=2953651 RepID=UPI00208FF23D|nr:HIRAN domain-containing protein [Pseudarthrobacter sp. MDT3-26]MCO4262507.1 HIRAN domain-containing protein [Pseudarthrobacter sp. MDT3-26]